MENWKTINGFSNYEVSDFGRVFGKPRNTTSGKILKQTKDSRDRFKVDIYNDDGKRKSIMVHRLVGTHFLPNFYGKTEIDHRNRNQHDNRVYNLRWVDSIENKYNTTTRKDNKSGKKGVYYDKSRNKYKALIVIDGKKIEKRFDTFEQACNYRDEQVKLHYDNKYYTE